MKYRPRNDSATPESNQIKRSKCLFMDLHDHPGYGLEGKEKHMTSR
jgi:hypothetical protein